MSKISVGILVALLCFPVALYAQPEKIIVGSGNFHPMIFISEGGKATGRDVDLWRLWSIKTGVPVEFRIMNWSEVIPALLNHEIDVANGASYTAERAKKMAFTEPYQEMLAYLFYHKDSKPVDTLSALSGHSVGVLQGSNVEEFLRFNAPGATLVPFLNYAKLVEGALKGRVNIFIAEEPLVSYHLTLAGDGETFRRSTDIILDCSLCMAVHLDEIELLELVNAGFANITAQERRQIDEGWFGIVPQEEDRLRREHYFFFLLLVIIAAFAATGALARILFREIPDIQMVREKFINLWIVFAAVALLPLALNAILRIYEFGWSILIWFYIAIAVIVIFLALFRNHIHYYARTAIVLLMLYIIGLGGLLVFGIVGTALLPLLSLVVATAILFGINGSIVSLSISLATIAIVGLAVQAGVWQYPHDIVAFTHSLLVWSGAFALFAFYAIGLGLGTAAVYQHMETALQAQHKSEAKFRALVETSGDWIWETDAQGKFIYASPQVEAILGYAPEEVLGKQFYAFMPPDEEKTLAATFRNMAREGKVITTLENVNLHKDGRRIVLESSGVPVFDAAGNMAGYRGVARDITERKKAEEERERLMFAIEQAGEAIVITDTDAKIQYVNPAFELITGYARDEAIGQPLRMLELDAQEETQAALWNALTRGETSSGRITGKKKDGTLFIEETTISPVRTASGKIVNYIAVQRDITHEIKLEEQWRQSQKMEAVGQLTSGIAHDFNNLLQAILGYGDLARSGLDAATPTYAFLEEIINASEHAAALVRQLLAFSRRQTLEMRDINLNDAIANLMKIIQRVIGEHIALEIRADEALGGVRADSGQIEQVLMNLCVNARDAMPQGGTITIATENIELDAAFCEAHDWVKPGRYALLSVTDTGCGMDEETRSKVFEPFFTTKEAGKGTGLGLAMVDSLVKQHGGFIHLWSEPGQGASFKIYLPISGQVTARPAETAPEPVTRGVETILIAEDDEIVRSLTQTMLQRAGYTILAAADGEAAARLFEEHAGEISLVILDVIMPKLNGLAACDRIRSLRPETRILFTSGYSIDTVYSNVAFNEITKMIQKPFHSDDLLRKVREALDGGDCSDT